MSDGPVKICICIPSHGDWKARFGKSLGDMMGFTQSVAAKHFGDGEFDLGIAVVGGSILPEVRTRLVADAAQWGATHILWADTDMAFPPDALVRLYNHGKHVCGVNYVTKDVEARPIAYVDNEEEIGPLFTEDSAEGLAEVKHTGFGLMLVTMQTFDAISLPYFHFEPVAPQNVIHKGEDVWFCRKVREEAGETVWVDQDLSKDIKHIGNWAYTHGQAITARDTREGAYEDRWKDGGAAASFEAWLAKNAGQKNTGQNEAAE